MEAETIQQLQRLTWAMRKTQAELLREYVGLAYKNALVHAKYGPRLRMAEQDDAEAPARVATKKARGVTVRIRGEEAVQLRRKSLDRTGDPADAADLVMEAVREKILNDESAD